MTNQEEIVRLEAEIANLNQELETRKAVETLKVQVARSAEQLAQLESELTEFKKFAYANMVRKGKTTIDEVPDDLRNDVLAQIG